MPIETLHPVKSSSGFSWRIVMAIALAGLAWVSFADSGIVRDKATGQPIAGAIVVAQWNGALLMPVQSTSTCYKVEVAISDASGKFKLPGLSWDLRPYLWGRSRGVRVLAAGRRESPESDSHDLRIVMEPDTRPPAEQLDRILDPLRARGCDSKSDAIFLPLLVAARRELVALPPSAETRKQVEWLSYEIEALELGPGEAERRRNERNAAEQKRLNISTRCSAPENPLDFACCYAFGDPRGFPALEEKLVAEKIAHVRREPTGELCVRRSDRDGVSRLAAEIVSGYR